MQVPPSWRSHRRSSGPRGRDAVLAVPALAWYIVFLIGPLVSIFYFSMTNATSMIAERSFIGLGNFRRLSADPVFWESARNTVIQVGISVPVMVVAGFMLGYYLSLGPRFAPLLRILFFTSTLLSLSTRAMIFYSILSPKGLVNQALGAVGLESLQHNWLVDSSTVLGVIIAVDLWAGIGFLAILFAAQLTANQPEILEASRIDGCGHWRSMWHISFGALRGFVGVIAMVQFLWTFFLSAGSVLLLTNGGPGTSSFTLSFLVWTKAFQQNDIGYSQAVGVVLFVVGLLGAIAIKLSLKDRT